LYTDREVLWESLAGKENNHWDMIVIGGGITGAGVLREAARQGLKVLLIEQRDFAWGTSSRSSKMVHGGMRYLAQGDFKLTKHSLKERERLLDEAPGLVERMGYYILMKPGQFPGRLVMTSVLKLYDFIAGIKDNRYFNRRSVGQVFPGIDTDNITGACYYTDAVTDDSRLVLRVLQEAQDCSDNKSRQVYALNYVKAKTLLKRNDRVEGVEIEDSETGRNLKLTASVVVNATGAWADRLRNEINPEKRVRPLRGSHLVIPRKRLPVDGVVSQFHPKDKRPVFIFPWEGATVVGTTDLDHRQNPDAEASITADEVDYLLQSVNNQFSKSKIGTKDIVATFSGVRPVISSEKSRDPSKERRDHAVWNDAGLITVSGGKLTTFRLIACDVMALALPKISKSSDSERSEAGAIDDRVFKPLKLKPEDILVDDTHRSRRLLGRYGDQSAAVLECANTDELQKIESTHYCLAECRWAIKHESVLHLDDLMLRRTRLGLLLPRGGDELFDSLQEIFAQELGWNNTRWNQEQKRYLEIWQQHYSLPKSA